MRAEPLVVERQSDVSTRLFLLVIAASIFVTVVTATMINVVLPIVRAEFAVSTAQVGWVVTVYSLAYAIGVPIYGRISDMFGVRRVFIFGLIGFVLGGLICTFAPNLLVLVVGRLIQGIGGAAVPALASIAVVKVLPAGNRGTALGMLAAAVGVGSSVGPLVGGALGQFFGWRALFVGSFALMALVIPLAQRLLPNGGADDERSIDLPGGVLLGLSVGLFLFGITQAQAAGFGAFSSWGCFVAAALTMAALIWHITRVAQPFVPPHLFANRPYVAAMVVGFCAMFANLSANIFAALLLVEVHVLTPGAAGLALTPAAVVVVLLSPVMGRLSDRIGMRPLIVAGLGVMALAALFLSTYAGASPVLIAAGIVGMSIGGVCVQSPTNNAAASSLPEGEIGAGMGLFSGCSFLGAGAGPAVIGALLAARQEAGSGAFNPWYAFAAAPFSDAFLAILLAPIVALIAARWLPARGRGRSQ